MNKYKILGVFLIFTVLGMTISSVAAATFEVHTQNRHHKAWTATNGIKFDDKANTLGFVVGYHLKAYDENGTIVLDKFVYSMTMNSGDKKYTLPSNAKRIKIGGLMGTGSEIGAPATDSAMVFSSVPTRKNFHFKYKDPETGEVKGTGYVKLHKLKKYY